MTKEILNPNDKGRACERAWTVWIFVLRHSINIRLGKRERVADQFESGLGSFRDNHLDDIEAEQDIGVIEQAQPGEATARNAFPFVAIDRLEGTAEIFARPRFYLDENESVALAADDIDFAAGASAEVTIQDFVTVPPQEPAGQVLPPRPKPQMPGRRTRGAVAPPVRKIGDESDKVRAHAVLSGAIPCRSLCAG